VVLFVLLSVQVMDSDLAIVRAEIKAWERNFRVSNGRQPSVQDIRDQPQIGIFPRTMHIFFI
jgi:hypothetical protein